MPKKNDSTNATYKHIDMVFNNLSRFSSELLMRGHLHDRSKLFPPEKADFDKYTPNLKKIKYNSAAYKKSLLNMKDCLAHHYSISDHHPEHFDKVDDMNLFQLVEMFCDWCASAKRSKDGDIYKSLKFNRKRFKIPKPIYNLMKNTADVFCKPKRKTNRKQ